MQYCLTMASLALASSMSMAQGPETSNFNVPTMIEAPKIDGKLDEEVWTKARKIPLNYVTRPFENTRPDVATYVYLYDDGETLYVAFDARDEEPENIRAFLRDRDNAWGDDLVGIKIDTYNDSRLAYQLFVNPLGVQQDSIENEITGDENDAWNGLWDARGEITDTGYQVEMAIPLNMFNFNESDQAQTWGVELLRFYPRDNFYRISNMPVDRNNDCALCQMGDMQGFAGARQGKNLTLVPALVVGRSESRDLDEGTDWSSTDNKEVGLDIKWGITPDMSLNATINPDFSQVEADVAQLSINDTFSLFFPETRNFFLENADYFSSNFDLVYTRNIAEPELGAKLTGRVGKQTFALFGANDKSTHLIVPGNLSSSVATIEEESQNMALRYRYDFTDDLSLGWISTARHSEDYHNYVYGFDSKYRITQQDTLKIQVLQSQTQYPASLAQEFCDAEEEECLTPSQVQCEFGECDYNEQVLRTLNTENFTGKAYRINYDHDERDWFLYASHNYQGDDFRADLGFLNRTDYEKSVLGGGYVWYKDNAWWNQFEIRGDIDITHNVNGELTEKEAELWINLDAAQDSYWEIGTVHRNRVGPRRDNSSLDVDGNTHLFEETFVQFFGEIRPASGLYLNTRIRTGDEIDFSNDRLGRILEIRPVVNWNLNKHLQLKLRHTHRKMEADNQHLFTARLTDMRLTYQFNVRSFLRLAVIYRDITRNQDNYLFDTVDENYESLATQLLYSYKVNPQTLFFLGYSDHGFQDDNLSRIRKDEKAVFAKFSYAWQP